MKYDHRYHAGNFADLLKHAIFQYIIQYAQHKPVPVHIIDTHAGFGGYDWSQLTYEAKSGVDLLLAHPVSTPLLKNYFQIVLASKDHGCLPGSPCLADELKRPEDHLWAFEKYEEPFKGLQNFLEGRENTHLRMEDGYAGLKALLPPISKRAIVIIDPPYERPEEYNELAKALQYVYKKFPQGTYMIWYPHSKRIGVMEPVFDVARQWGEKVLRVDYYSREVTEGLTGAGLLIINPPFSLQAALEDSRSECESLGLDLAIDSL